MEKYLISLIFALLANGIADRAVAAPIAVATVDLRMRAGPSTMFPVVDVIPNSANVDLHGCVSGYSWCDVSAAGSRGWVYSRFLRANGDSEAPVAITAPQMSLPITSFSIETYWSNYYRARPFYSERSRWRNRWRENWPDRSRDWRASS